jgi:hypothetical protein
VSDTDEKDTPAAEWPITVKLSVPVEWGKGEPIRELTFRRWKPSDGIGVNLLQPTIENFLAVASRMCGQPVAMLQRVDMDDIGEVNAIAVRFFGKCLTTGNAASPS